jgi:hypothetical protein
METDASVRAAYEDRAAHSEPGLESEEAAGEVEPAEAETTSS